MIGAMNQRGPLKRKIRKREDARNVSKERKGYWGCETCFVHNRNNLSFCFNCGAKRKS
jgi:hypothetical protein